VTLIIDPAKPSLKMGSLQKGLVGHWMLDEKHYNPATKRVTDLSAYCNHGISHNAAVFGADRMGQANRAMVFDPVANDAINCGNDPSLNLTEFTIAAWVNPTGLSRWHRMMSKGEYTSGWVFGITNTNKIDLSIADVDSTYHTIYGDSSLSATWQHVVATYSKSLGVVKLYLNNIIDRAPYSLVKDIKGVGLPIKIGKSESGWNLDGRMPEIRLYNRLLTAAERTLLYESYRPGITISPAP